MRNLVFALILANFGFAAWERWYAEAPPEVPLGEREFGDIVLAAEFEATNPRVELPTVRITEVAVADVGADAEIDGPPAEPLLAEVAVPEVEFLDLPVDRGARAQPGTGELADAGGDLGDAGAPADALPETVPETTAVALAATAAPAGALVCMSVGPFRELSQVSAAAANLRADGIESSQRAGEGEIWSGYWVYLERIESVTVARGMIDRLHEAGLTDAYIIPNSDSGTLISLGVFSEIIRASRVRERVRQLDYDATIADRVRRATVYWIDVNVPDGTLLDFERLQPAGRIIRLEQRPCSEVQL